MNAITPFLLAKIESLPCLSPLASRLLAIDLNHPHAKADFIRVAESAPSLSAKLVGMANSVFYGMPGVTIETIADALDRTGLQVAMDIAMGDMFSGMPVAIGKVYTRKMKWLHVMGVAFACREIAKIAGARISPATAYFAGLVHDLGVLAIDYIDSNLLDDIFRLVSDENMTLADAEIHLVGATHTQLGALLGQKWNLPAEVVHAIEHHHNVEQAATSPLTAAVMIAEHLLNNDDVLRIVAADDFIGRIFDVLRRPEVESCLQVLQLTEAQAKQLVPRLQAQLEWYDQMANTFHCD